MVEKYVPKVGDKVRATLGESVVVGEVAEVTMQNNYPMVVDVFAGSHTFDNVALIAHGAEGWHFEQIVSVPTKFGAVIRRADGVLLSLQDTKNRDNRWLAPSDNWQWCDDADATAGGFTVLFDGVDE